MFVIYLNDMRFPHVEQVVPVLRGPSREAVERFIEGERVEAYAELGESSYGPTTWHKSFRKGGPLEWYNQPDVCTNWTDTDKEIRSYRQERQDETDKMVESYLKGIMDQTLEVPGVEG